MPKRLGQHFLASNSALSRISDACAASGGERIVEIGPGRGALTRRLIPITTELHAIELDLELVEHLKAELSGAAHFTIHHGDVLNVDWTQWGPATIVGNLPYYITSPILERFAGLDDRFPVGVFLMQLEVAQRVVARPGTRDYGYLSVSLQLACHAEMIAKVPPGSFVPPPKVDSAIVRLTRKASSERPSPELLQLVSRSFRNKRKTLRNNLRPYYSLEQLNLMKEADLRAEQLSLTQFVELQRKLEASTEELDGMNPQLH